MNEFKAVLKVKKEDVKRLEEILALDNEEFQNAVSEGDVEEDVVYFSTNVRFENKYTIYVSVCTGQNNAYLDVVLFNAEGDEVSSVTGEDLLDEVEFEIESENIKFHLDIIEE